ncbi:MAG: macro domain-containing protein [Chromatiales bacterium]|nr:macro domain-containing protein [Chromatiales bacterium]
MTPPARPGRNARLSWTTRDVLDAPTPVVPVNLVGVMGRGLALAARNRWSGISAAYAAALASRRLRGPRVGPNEREPATAVAWPAPTQQVVILAPTKQHWRAPSPPELVRDAVQALVPTARAARRRSLNVPPLGCGLGGLSPRIVLPWVLDAVEASPDIRWTLHRWPHELLVEAADRISRIRTA